MHPGLGHLRRPGRCDLGRSDRFMARKRGASPPERGLLARDQRRQSVVRRRELPHRYWQLRPDPAQRGVRRHPRLALERAGQHAGDRSAGHGRRRPLGELLGFSRVVLRARPRDHLRPLQRTARHLVDVLAGRLYHVRRMASGGDAVVDQRSALRRRDPTGARRRERLGR